ncbi:MAG: nucleoside deaminase [Verrucomicrobiota bacterium]
MSSSEIKVGIEAAYAQALKSFSEGGVPVGASLLIDGEVVSVGHNQRHQKKSNILHGEMDCIENAGHDVDFTRATIFSSLSPCIMCSNAILLFRIPRLVILDDTNTGDFETNVDFLRGKGVEVIIKEHGPSMELNRRFQTEPETRPLWMADVGIS